MKTMTHLKLCLFAGLLLAGIAGCGQKETKPEPVKPTLEGRWTGYDLGQPGAKCTLTVAGGQLEYRGADSNDWCRGTYVVNDKVQPPQLDLTFQASPAPELVGKIALGLYGLQGDRLSVAISEPGSNERPVSLAGGPHIRLFSFKHD